MKKCSRCAFSLPTSDFNKCSSNKDKLQYNCRKCQNELRVLYMARPEVQESRKLYRKIRWEENKKDIKQRRKPRRQPNTTKTCTDCCIEKLSSEFYGSINSADGLRWECKDCCNAKSVAWQKANPERAREFACAWKIKNPEKKRASDAACLARRRTIIKELGKAFTADEWIDLKEKYDYTCLRCLRREPEIKLSPDHIVPLARGGSNSIDNIQPLCCKIVGNCQSIKGKRIIDYREHYVQHAT